MSLKNITKEDITVKYNSIERVVKPGDELDVRDFNIDFNNIEKTEAALIDKYGRGNLEAAAGKEKNLEIKNEQLKKELEDAYKKIAELEEVFDSQKPTPETESSTKKKKK